MKLLRKILKIDTRVENKLLILCIGITLIFQSSQVQAGIPLKNPKISKQEATQMYMEMKRQKEEMARRIAEKRQEKKKEEKQLIEGMKVPMPIPEEEKPSAKPVEEKARGIGSGVSIPEEEIEQAKKIEKREKAAQEVKYERNFSFILVILVLLATIVFLIRSVYKGRPKAENEKK